MNITDSASVLKRGDDYFPDGEQLLCIFLTGKKSWVAHTTQLYHGFIEMVLPLGAQMPGVSPDHMFYFLCHMIKAI